MAQAKVKRMLPIESTMVRAIGFDHMTPGVDHGYLVVQFANEDVYGYENVPWNAFLALMNSTSFGTAFHAIKTSYKATKLDRKKDTHIVNSGDVKPAPKPKEEDAPMFDVLTPGGSEPRMKKKK